MTSRYDRWVQNSSVSAKPNFDGHCRSDCGAGDTFTDVSGEASCIRVGSLSFIPPSSVSLLPLWPVCAPFPRLAVTLKFEPPS